MIEHLTFGDVLSFVEDLGVGPVRDIGLLDSAVHRPRVSLFGRDACPGFDDKAAVLLESLVDGNERLGWLSLAVFYGLNGIDLDAPDDQAYGLVIAVASGSRRTRKDRRASRCGTYHQRQIRMFSLLPPAIAMTNAMWVCVVGWV